MNRKRRRFRLYAGAALAAGLLLRLWFVVHLGHVAGDSLVYGEFAKNLLLHHMYGFTWQGPTPGSVVIHPTLIRLPGYPLFLAACFRLFGMENYWAAAVVQIVVELFGWILLAFFAARITSAAYRRAAAQATLWLACLCPFTAVYDAMPLTEALSLFCMCLALWSAARSQDRPGWRNALLFTVG